MAKKKGYGEKPLRTKGGIHTMTQAYYRGHEKLTFLRVIGLLGVWMLLLTPLALIALFFISLSSG
jgi:hypothetical protein